MNKAMALIIGGLVATLGGVGTIETSITGNALLTGILVTAIGCGAMYIGSRMIQEEV